MKVEEYCYQCKKKTSQEKTMRLETNEFVCLVCELEYEEIAPEIVSSWFE